MPCSSSSPPPSPPKIPFESCEHFSIAPFDRGFPVLLVHFSTLQHTSRVSRQRTAASTTSIYSIIEIGRFSIILWCHPLVCRLFRIQGSLAKGQMASVLRRGTTAHKMHTAVPRYMGVNARHLGGHGGVTWGMRWTAHAIGAVHCGGRSGEKTKWKNTRGSAMSSGIRSPLHHAHPPSSASPDSRSRAILASRSAGRASLVVVNPQSRLGHRPRHASTGTPRLGPLEAPKHSFPTCRLRSPTLTAALGDSADVAFTSIDDVEDA